MLVIAAIVLAPFASPVAERSFDKWKACSEQEASTLVSSGEPANVVAEVAMFRCGASAQDFYLAEGGANGLISVEQHEIGLRAYLMDQVVKARVAKHR